MQKTDPSTYDQRDKGRLVYILLLFISAGLNAQFYEYGQDAGSLKWHQFRTPNYKVIFPRGLDSLANAFANRLEYYYEHIGEPLDHRHAPIPVIIHNESSFSNGVFVWAPKRLEIFTNPDPNGYHQDWLTQLALHEGRHAVQIDKMNQGITKALSYLGGEQVAGGMAVFLPYWYLEGDAVDSETRLSNTGRGRQPSFEMELKAQLLESDEIYSFSKATLGSYRNHIPDHYQLGYMMLRYGRRTYGNKFWIDFQQYAARRPYLLNPTFFSMRNYGVRSKRGFYRSALQSFQAHWRETASTREYTPFVNWTQNRPRPYTSYTFPQFISSSMYLAYKSGMDQIPEFVFLGEGGKEKRVFRPGFMSSGRVSFSGSHVVWDEYVPDTRWTNRNYSVVRTYELATGKVRSLGRKTRYYSPDVSKGGSQIAVIEQTETQQFNLVILQLDGTRTRSISSPGNQFIQQPAWMEADTAIVVLLSEDSGKCLYSYSLASGRWRKHFDAGMDDISFPVVHGNRIYFGGTFSGIDNIYCLNLEEQQVFQVTSARFGAFHPQISGDGKTLVYSDYTARGYNVNTLPLSAGLWKPLELARDHTEQLDYAQTTQEARITGNVAGADTLEFESRRYSKALHLINIHSWLPLYFDYLNPELSLNPEHLPVNLGVSLISQNHLSTAVSQLGYEYRDGYHLFHSGIKLSGRYPVLNLSFDYGGEPNVLLMDEGDSVLSLPNNLMFTAQTYIPFRFNTGRYVSLIQPRIDYAYRRDVQYVESEDNYSTGAHYFYYTLYGSTYLRKGYKDILPRVGMNLTGGYYHAPFNNQVYGAVVRAGGTLYLPGLLKHQTIRIGAGYQRQYPLDMSRPAFINLMGIPRGLRGVFGEKLTKVSVDYVLPLLYPDLAVGSLLYITRIRGALWSDYMWGTNVIIKDPNPYYDDRNYNTVGFDLVVDLNLLRITFPLSVGGRIIYEPDTGNFTWEAIYSVEIN